MDSLVRPDFILVTGKAQTRGKTKVAPKYRHPEDSSVTWTGRGRKPKWILELLEQGKTLEDLEI